MRQGEQHTATREHPSQRDPRVGVVIDQRYRIDARIAAGGFGTIYRATDVFSGRVLALKILHRDLVHEPAIVARFHREADVLAQLRGANTVTIYGAGVTADYAPYLAMEMLGGETLFARSQRVGPLPWRTAVQIARGVCSALAEAHALGIVHRDLKPANIHLERMGHTTDFVKVLDFGIAKVVDERAPEAELTLQGEVIGTFDYMSPEQMLGGLCSARSDIFTLGIVMFEMLAGSRPFGDPSGPVELLAAVLGAAPPLVSTRVVVPAQLARLIARCLEREPEHRFATMLEIDAELAKLLDDGTDDEAETAVSQALDEEDTWIGEAPFAPPPAVNASPPVHASPAITLPGIVAARGSVGHLTPALAQPLAAATSMRPAPVLGRTAIALLPTASAPPSERRLASGTEPPMQLDPPPLASSEALAVRPPISRLTFGVGFVLALGLLATLLVLVSG